MTSTSHDNKSIVLIGLMGAGKTSVGRRLEEMLGLTFVDSDDEVVIAAGCAIDDIFELYGEAAFRELERRVIERLLSDEPHILATGGGAFMDGDVRAVVKERGVSVWLRADLDILSKRTRGRRGRPLLADGDPNETLKKLIEIRYPIYAEADIIIDGKNETPAKTTQRVADALTVFLSEAKE